MNPWGFLKEFKLQSISENVLFFPDEDLFFIVLSFLTKLNMETLNGSLSLFLM